MTRHVTRAAVHSAGGGVVASQHWRAARAGARVLADGGNAIDAAVTAAMVLSVVEPWLSGLGGGGFLVRVDASGQASTLDFNVVSPRALDPGRYPLLEGRDGDWFDWPSVEEDRNLVGFESIAVPGAVAGFAAALERHGTIGFAEALEPAIEEAERGFEIDWFAALCLAIDADALSRFPVAARTLLDGGAAPRPAERGEPRMLPLVAKSAFLRRLRDEGARSFYTGDIAAELVADLRIGGSVLGAEDFAAYEARWAAPAEARYRDHRVVTMDGASGGPALLEMLRRLESDPAYARDTRVTAADHATCARAVRAVYEERLQSAGHAGAGGDCTSHVSVIDRDGVAVALTNTLLSRFGSKVMLPGSGLLMNNGLMWFDPRPGQPNSITAGVRPLANMCPLVAVRDGAPWLALGAAGGRQIFPAVGQLLSRLIDHAMTLEAAFHAPRIDASAPTVQIDRRTPPETAALIAREAPVALVDDDLYPVRFAVPSAVAREPDGTLLGMVHPTQPWGAAVSAETAS